MKKETDDRVISLCKGRGWLKTNANFVHPAQAPARHNLKRLVKPSTIIIRWTMHMSFLNSTMTTNLNTGPDSSYSSVNSMDCIQFLIPERGSHSVLNVDLLTSIQQMAYAHKSWLLLLTGHYHHDGGPPFSRVPVFHNGIKCQAPLCGLVSSALCMNAPRKSPSAFPPLVTVWSPRDIAPALWLQLK